MLASDAKTAAEAKEAVKTVIFAWVTLGLFTLIASTIFIAMGDFTI